MTNGPTSANTEALARLAAYLAQDPGNLLLLADLFDHALAAHAFSTAAGCVDQVRALHASTAMPVEWLQRDLALATMTGDVAHATAAAERLIERVGPNELALGVLAQLALARGDWAACLAMLDSAATAPAGLPTSLAGLKVRALHHAGRLDEAVSFAQSMIGRGETPDLLGAAAVAALDLARYDLAGQWSAAALAQDPASHDARVTQATLALAAQDGARAIDLLREPATRRPRDGRTLSALGFAMLAEGRSGDAAAYLARALETMPTHVGTWLGLGWSLLLQGDSGKALAAFEEAVRRDRNFADSHGSVAVVLAHTGDSAGALAAIRRAQGLDPASLSARYAQAVLDGSARDARIVSRMAASFVARAAVAIAAPTR